MRKIQVKVNDYKSYLHKYKTNKLDNGNIIETRGGFPKFFNIKEEIFNGIECEYKIKSQNSDECLIIFKSKSGNEYRLDLMREPNTQTWHLAFSLFDVDRDNYHDLTGKDESFDVFNRLIWILKDITPKLGIGEYCIGATGTKKDDIYKYMMKSIDGWEKRDTTQYDLGWALYFKLI